MKATTEIDCASISSRKQRMPSSILILTVLLSISACLNIFLASKVRELTDSLIYIKGESSLKIGEKVPAISAKNLDGNTVTIAYDGRRKPLILYVFTPQCKWCYKNLQNVQTLANELHEKFDFVGLSLSTDQLKEYVTQHDLDFPVITDLPITTIQAYKLGGTPQTIVVSPDGEVLKNWVGAYQESMQKEVEDYFNIQMPGIIDTERKVNDKIYCDECEEQSSPQK